MKEMCYECAESGSEEFFEKENQPGHFYTSLLTAETEILKNLLNPLKIGMIAQTVHMSQSSLLRQFKRRYGKSIQVYYIEKRMELARKLIVDNNISIKEISEKLGYSQPSHFIKTFKKVFGYSPGKCGETETVR